MKILFYGRLGDIIGRETRVEIPSDACSVAELRQILADLHPDASGELTKPSLRACVCDTIVSEDFCLRGGETVEFFPPLSGG